MERYQRDKTRCKNKTDKCAESSKNVSLRMVTVHSKRKDVEQAKMMIFIEIENLRKWKDKA